MWEKESNNSKKKAGFIPAFFVLIVGGLKNEIG
jgi:hypothetical protein